ncbi:FAD-binding protein [Lacrimispora xylanisolvens]|uniref:FAD-binding protein n=1 Tax=Lacrimispora xylanisolvens TaxID=384636 RepID=UPI0024026FC3
MEINKTLIQEMEFHTVVVGTGAAGFNAASRLKQYGVNDIAIIVEQVNAGTSRNTGSDKQTYYKLSLAGKDEDSVLNLAEDLFAGQCVDGDVALCEAALSTLSFYRLVELGVPFPCTEFGEYVGYKTDHDRGRRATSVGPYTSKIMTQQIEKDVRSKQIQILDRLQVIHIMVEENEVCGVLCLDLKSKDELHYVIIWCQNIVYATGGPAGMYHDSVYPESQLGSSGIAFAAGVRGKNLTEWQFGMASLQPRWNVSGTYMQVLPRLVSTDSDGTDEREFLLDYFDSKEEMLSLLFLKGYQWPFDTNKIFGGSSIIDLLVYQETIIKKRRVFSTTGKILEIRRLYLRNYHQRLMSI